MFDSHLCRSIPGKKSSSGTLRQGRRRRVAEICSLLLWSFFYDRLRFPSSFLIQHWPSHFPYYFTDWIIFDIYRGLMMMIRLMLYIGGEGYQGWKKVYHWHACWSYNNKVLRGSHGINERFFAAIRLPGIYWFIRNGRGENVQGLATF